MTIPKKLKINGTQSQLFIKGLYDTISLCIVKLLKIKNQKISNPWKWFCDRSSHIKVKTV